MECLQGHLGGRLTYTLSCQCPYSLSWLYNGSVHSFYVHLEEQLHLAISNPVETISKILLICFVLAFDPLVIFCQILRFILEVITQINQNLLLKMLIQTNNPPILNQTINLQLSLLHNFLRTQILLGLKIGPQ